MRLTGMPTALIYTKPGMFIIKPLLGTRYVVLPTLLDGIRTDRISPLSHGQPQGKNKISHLIASLHLLNPIFVHLLLVASFL